MQFVLALAEDRHRPTAEAIVNEIGARSTLPPISIVVGETYDALNAADVAAVTSGTATLETGVIGTPMAIVYKTSAINYKLLRPLIDVEHFGLINLIAGERVANELIQDDLTPETLAAELFQLLDPKVNADVRGALRSAAEKLGHGGASRRAAEAILKIAD
jgi:lipid-A-disaccharide synthase